MTGDGARDLPAIVISLQDGRQLRVDADGMQLGDQVYQLERVEDARQISPYPETIGLRVAGVGLLTVVPARPGDAALALEALYLRRPTLRPPVSAPMPGTAGSLPVAGPWLYGPPPPPGYLPVPPMGAMPPYPPFPPFGPPIMYGPPINYGPLPTGFPPGMSGESGARRGALGPWPRGIGDVIGSSFRLYWQDLWRFILLGIAVAFWQPLLVGIMQIGVLVLLGVDPRNGTIQPVNGILQPPLSTPGNSTAPPSPVVHLMSLTPQQIAALVGASVLLMLLLLFFSVWQVSALSIAARESILGRPARTGAAMLGGLKRMPSVLGTMLLVFLILVGIMLVLEVGIIAAGARLIAVLASSLDEIAPAAYLEIAGITVAVMVFYVVLLVTSLYVSVRLQFAASAAAGDRLSPGRALGRSWVLTRGNWWRSFLPGLAMSVVAGSAGMGASSGAVVSPIVVYLFVTPLLTAVLAPLMVITFMVVYYDLRLRREGYLPLAKELGMPVFSPPFPGPTVPPSPPPQVDGSTQRGRSPSA